MHSKLTRASYKNHLFCHGCYNSLFSISRTPVGGNQNLAKMCFPSLLLFPEVAAFLLLCLIPNNRLIPSQASTCFVTWKAVSAISYLPHHPAASCSPRVASLNGSRCPQNRITLHSTVSMPRRGFQWGNCFDSLGEKKKKAKKKLKSKEPCISAHWVVKGRWNVSKA